MSRFSLCFPVVPLLSPIPPFFSLRALLLPISVLIQGEWGTTAADIDPPRPVEDITQIRSTLATLSREFRVMIAVLLTDLAWQGDTEMRFLGIRLNYNEVR
jgi:hypothetical protein